MRLKNKTTRFLTASLIAVSVICVFVFTFLAARMNGRGADTIQEIGAGADAEAANEAAAASLAEQRAAR